MIFDVKNSSSIHLKNYRNFSLLLGEEPANYINDSVSEPKFCLSLHYNGDNTRGVDLTKRKIVVNTIL